MDGPSPWLTRPARLRLDVERRDVEVRVGEQRHLRGVAGDLADLADEPVGRDDRIVDADPAARARGDPDLLLELARRPRDDVGGDRTVVLREARQADVVQLARRSSSCCGRVRVLDRLARAACRAARAGARSRTSRGSGRRTSRRCPGTGAATRLAPTSNGRSTRRAGALDAVQPAARRLTEIDGDQDEREQHEHSRHDSPLDGGGTAGGRAGGPGARSGGPQDRNPCAAVPVLHENEPV